MKAHILLSFLLGLGTLSTWAQDPHFSQPLTLAAWNNPAATGLFEGHTRLSSALRQQWTGLPSGFRTQFVGAELNREGLGFGGQLVQEQAGESGYRHLQASAQLAIHRPVAGGTLSLGATAGVIQQSLDPTGLTFDSQYDAIGGFDATLPSGEFLAQNKAVQPDLGVGLHYRYVAPDLGPLMEVSAGLTLHHINQPNLSLMGGEALLPRRLGGHLTSQWLAGGRTLLHTGLRYAQQGEFREWWVEAGLSYELDPEIQLYAGLGWRKDDAWVPVVALDFNHARIGLSYDLTSSSLGSAIGRQGGPEITFSWRLGAPARPLRDYHARQGRSRHRQASAWWEEDRHVAAPAAPQPVTLVLVVPAPTTKTDTVVVNTPKENRPTQWAPVLFPVNIADVDPMYYDMLDQLATYLKQHATFSIVLIGHTDQEGTAWYNYQLGQRRAQAVSLYLSQRGIDPARITTMSYGEMKPYAPGQDADSRARNRRTEILIFP
ncbi:MAG: type IX secretion system membrane protein PorP/SprF [Bacteroidetes bacterium]|nr:MAG: type IX secretion system membrane protein PorP/SprF [Bacteroidota bacterium]